MPEISRFYGIVIRMFYKPKEHEPIHIHAYYGEEVGIFDVKMICMIEGSLPAKAQELIVEWLRVNQSELIEMWTTQNIKKIPPLE